MLSFKAVVFVFFSVLTIAAAAPKAKRTSVTKVDLQATDKDVTQKLNQLHKVIDSLQKTVQGLNEGYDLHAKENAEKMKRKFDKLSSVISKLGIQKTKLYTENKKLRHEKTALVDKIAKLEENLQQAAEAAKNAGVEAWLRSTAADLKAFLAESGLEHFASPKFSPLIAGVVSNGVVVIPLAVTSLFLLRYVKHLTILRIVMALNLFDVGFSVAVICSAVLLLGDSFEGLRHISEVNFIFIQLVLAGVFFLTCTFLVIASVQNRKNKACKYATAEILIRIMVAVDYFRRVWSPVIDREDVPIALPVWSYVAYLCASGVAVKLTACANYHSAAAQRRALEEESEQFQSVPFVRTL